MAGFFLKLDSLRCRGAIFMKSVCNIQSLLIAWEKHSTKKDPYNGTCTIRDLNPDHELFPCYFNTAYDAAKLRALGSSNPAIRLMVLAHKFRRKYLNRELNGIVSWKSIYGDHPFPYSAEHFLQTYVFVP